MRGFNECKGTVQLHGAHFFLSDNNMGTVCRLHSIANSCCAEKPIDRPSASDLLPTLALLLRSSARDEIM